MGGTSSLQIPSWHHYIGGHLETTELNPNNCKEIILEWNDNYNELFAKASKGIEGPGSSLWWPLQCLSSYWYFQFWNTVVWRGQTAYLSSKPRKKPLPILSPTPTIMMRPRYVKSTRLEVRRVSCAIRCSTAPWPPTESRMFRLLSLSRAESQPYNSHCSNNSALPRCRTERYKGSFPLPVAYKLAL